MEWAGASNTPSGSRLVRDQRPTFGSLLPSAGVLEQLKSGKQNSNWCLHAPAKGMAADTYGGDTVARKHAVPVNLVHLPVFRRADERNLRTAKCFTQGTNSLAWIATPTSRSPCSQAGGSPRSTQSAYTSPH